MFNLLKGKLTYCMAFLAIGVGLYGLVTGTFEKEVSLGIIWAGLSLFGIRRAVS